jgi:phospholipase C
MDDPIRHVVVLMLENNSFDRMLGCMKEAYPDLEGVDPNALPRTNPDYPDATHMFGQLSGATLTVAQDPGHELDDVLRQIHGGCSGFVADEAQHCPAAPQSERYQIMAYFEKGELLALHTLAENFLVCDHWFSSVPGPTWPNRFFVHTGTSLGHVDMPNGFFHPGVHLYDQTTAYDHLNEKGISWKIYFGDFPQSLLLTHQWPHPTGYRHLEKFFEDTAGPEAEFPQYAFIEPYYFGAKQNDQHPPTDVRHGEALIAQVYNALRGNEDLWKSTLFVLLYDEHGGFYDHVEPPETVPPDKNTKTFAFDVLGVRVPALLISPWVDPGVLKTQFDHTSLLKYLTDKWNLGPLGERTAQANTFTDVLTKRMSPRPDCPKTIAVPVPTDNSTDIPLNGNQTALAGFSHYLEVNVTKSDDATLAAQSRAMAGTYTEQSAAVAERADHFLTRKVLVGGSGNGL